MLTLFRAGSLVNQGGNLAKFILGPFINHLYNYCFLAVSFILHSSSDQLEVSNLCNSSYLWNMTKRTTGSDRKQKELRLRLKKHKHHHAAKVHSTKSS